MARNGQGPSVLGVETTIAAMHHGRMPYEPAKPRTRRPRVASSSATYSGSHCSWTVSGMPTVERDKESIGTSGIWRYRTPQEPGPNITAHRYRAEEEGFSPVVTGTRFEDGFSWVAARGFAPKKRRLRQQRWLRGAAARRRQDRDADVPHRHGGTSVAKLSDGSRRGRLRLAIFPDAVRDARRSI